MLEIALRPNAYISNMVYKDNVKPTSAFVKIILRSASYGGCSSENMKSWSSNKAGKLNLRFLLSLRS